MRSGIRKSEAAIPVGAATVEGAVAAVMVHVADPAAGIAWYERAFPDARRESIGLRGPAPPPGPFVPR
jgi:hypothetical protein